MQKIPIDQFEISVWKELKVYNDIHIQFDKAYYSVPYQYKKKIIWARKTISQVTIFFENELIAVHVPAKPGERRTNYDHYPPDKYDYMKYDSSYCKTKAIELGTHVYEVVNNLLNNEPIRYLRAAQNIVRLCKKYNSFRLEKACERALHFNNYTYKSIKQILEQELDKIPYLFEMEKSNKLNNQYAYDIKKFLSEEVNSYGNRCAN